MVDITILEVHLPDGQFTAPFAVGGDTGSESETAEASGNDTEAGTSGSALAVLLVLVALAALAWYLRRDEAA